MKKNPRAKVAEAPAQDGLREFVFYLEKLEHPDKIGFNGITRTLWAKSPEEATERMKKSWGEQMGYSVKFLHSMEDFRRKKELEEAYETGKKVLEADKPETENV